MRDSTDKSAHIHHYQRHATYSYPVRLSQRIHATVTLPVILLIFTILAVRFFPVSQSNTSTLDWHLVIFSLLSTLYRLLIAYGFALVISVPIALLINVNSVTERLLLPFFDIVQSIPVLAFFPVIIALFLHYGFVNAAAVFIIFLSMLWNLVFSLVGGLRIIPSDIRSAAQVFNIRQMAYLRKIILPAIFPYIVTGSLLAWAQGWNIIIVAEVLHTYIPGGGSSLDVYGIGSLLVHASANGQSQIFLASISAMVIMIGLINFFVWQKLLHLAERFRFE
ncbi:MAG: ABC transporter permease subunit [Candidatus Saccharimonadia bacterium]